MIAHLLFRARSGRTAFAAFLVLTATPLAAQHQEVDAFLRNQVESRRIPGVSVAVVRDGEVVLARGYGVANVEGAIPATEETVYELASVTKQFTATAIMMLVEEERLSLDSRLTEVIDELPAAWNGVTIRHLLSHTSGIRSYTSVPGFANNVTRDYTQREVLALVADSPLEFASGEGWNYSNTGYFLLGMVIEKVTGADYGAFLAERIFKPLGMTSTRVNDLRAPIPNRARGYAREAGAVRPVQSVSPTQPFAAGALIGTVLDLARWDAALYSDRLLPSAVLENMWTPTSLASGEMRDYGFGWEVSQYRSHRRLSHGGGIPGFNTYIARFPDDRTTVVVLANLAGAGSELLANAVAGFYIPGLREQAARPIADSDPQTTFALKEVATRLAAGTGDPERFTDEARSFFFPDRIGEGSQLGSFGSLGTFELMEERAQGAMKVRGYRALFGAVPMRISFTLAEDGKIAGIGLRPEEIN